MISEAIANNLKKHILGKVAWDKGLSPELKKSKGQYAIGLQSAAKSGDASKIKAFFKKRVTNQNVLAAVDAMTDEDVAELSDMINNKQGDIGKEISKINRYASMVRASAASKKTKRRTGIRGAAKKDVLSKIRYVFFRC